MISTSLKGPNAIFSYPPEWMPKPAIWRNYIDAFMAAPVLGLFFSAQRYFIEGLNVGATKG